MKNNKIIIFIVLVIISFLLERYNLPCPKQSTKTLTISLIHHITATYLYFGTFIFPYYQFNLFIIFITLLSWIIFNNRCIITVYYNRICGIPEDNLFYDTVFYLRDNYKLKNINWFIIIISLIYNLYFLLEKKI
tara:strand:- start:559 stop:960 length:402 start_codon:yes stop_codon:yes gene_type:complete